MTTFSAVPRLGLLGDSFIYTCASVRSHVCRHSVTLACALGSEPLTVTVGGRRWVGQLVAMRPFSPREIDSGGQPVALIDLEPTHLRYNTFSRSASGPPPVLLLDPDRFAGLITCARAFADRTLDGRRLQASVQLQVGSVADSIGPLRPVDPRVLSMMAAVRMDTGLSLAALGRHVGMSATQASRTFVEALGITVRQYSLAAKIQRAAMFFGSGRALTEIALASGFTDSAHLAKVWMRCYGASPSRHFGALRGADDSRVDHAWRQRVRLGSTA
jgi:AraC-like DNA-binding protein